MLHIAYTIAGWHTGPTRIGYGILGLLLDRKEKSTSAYTAENVFQTMISALQFCLRSSADPGRLHYLLLMLCSLCQGAGIDPCTVLHCAVLWTVLGSGTSVDLHPLPA